ncbi:MAG: Tpl protein [Candidatus Cloacimonetes bacterium]|jgi:cell fate regulator YaaT (PSP1 superfamily)|nr:Tpl protein [Candidatus Cloacimonadota bacterium]
MRDYVELLMRTGRIEYFVNSNELKIEPEMKVIVKAERGEDMGEVVHCAVQADNLAKKFADGKIGKIKRIATDADFVQLEAVTKKEIEAKARFWAMLDKYSFEMKIINAVYQLDGNKITFFFSADGRIDFRDLVRELATEFRTRIELHQTSGREDARRLCGLGMCGRTYCCVTFLKKFNQVTIQMAKNQNLLNNLSKISGPCGRLLCCLHYEEKFYKEKAEAFPKLGARIKYEDKLMFVNKNDYYNDKIELISKEKERINLTLEEFDKLKK